jgi:hypothetical protein
MASWLSKVPTLLFPLQLLDEQRVVFFELPLPLRTPLMLLNHERAVFLKLMLLR